MATTQQAVPTRDGRDSQVGLGQVGQGVYISCATEDVDSLVDTFTRWFANRDDITLVDSGSAEKLAEGFVILEWDGRVDRRVLNWLQHQAFVTNFSLYTAFHGQEEQA
ncbi:MAG: hypothetical protein ACYDER_07985 [Ktedonobacteraceae bacterium]